MIPPSVRSIVPFADIAVGMRFLAYVPRMLRRTVTLDEARVALRRRLEGRDAAFLFCLAAVLHRSPTSPYGRLLQLAGCQYGDVEAAVRRDGIEATLKLLLRAGVYLTLEEFKGRQPVVRGSTTFRVDPRQLAHPDAHVHLAAYSSGSRGAKTYVGIDLRAIREEATDTVLAREAYGDRGWRHAVWGVPGGWSILRILDLATVGATPERWFSQVDPRDRTLHARYRWSARALEWGGRLAGVRVPRPEHVPSEDPAPILRWIGAVLRNRQTPNVVTFASAAVRVCRAAAAAGIEIRGARFTVSGEPITSARVAAIRDAGAEVLPFFGTTETGPLAHGCRAPEVADDFHLQSDLHAVIQPGAEHARAALPARALLLTSLGHPSRMCLLNVSLGDHATLTARRCGCLLEDLGWTTHVHTVRSHTRLTAGGMTFPDVAVIDVLEDHLPRRFGGGATDYQLWEEEGPDGLPHLRLLVDPRLGPLDPDTVRRAFLEALGSGTGVERLMGISWQEAGLVQVERRPPVATDSGKILHLQERKGAPR